MIRQWIHAEEGRPFFFKDSPTLLSFKFSLDFSRRLKYSGTKSYVDEAIINKAPILQTGLKVRTRGTGNGQGLRKATATDRCTGLSPS